MITACFCVKYSVFARPCCRYAIGGDAGAPQQARGAGGKRREFSCSVQAMIAFFASVACWRMAKSLMCGRNGWRPDCAVTPSEFLNLECVSIAALPWLLAALLVILA